LLFSGLHVLCPYLEVNRLWSSLGVTRRFVVVDAAFFSYGRLCSQIILEAVSRDIRVAVSIWYFCVILG
jgi:hypothetical protein